MARPERASTMPYRDNRGVRVHYRVDGTPDGPPLVLQIGFLLTLQEWYEAGYVAVHAPERLDSFVFGDGNPGKTDPAAPSPLRDLLRQGMEDLARYLVPGGIPLELPRSRRLRRRLLHSRSLADVDHRRRLGRAVEQSGSALAGAGDAEAASAELTAALAAYRRMGMASFA